jgi:hypothetical protein
MDLRQRRLTAEEWEALEVPVSREELRILKLIHYGFENVNISDNDTMSLINFVKIDTEKKALFDVYFYDKYFKALVKKLFTKYNFVPKQRKKIKNKSKIKKKDLIRIQNLDKKIDKIKENVFEFVLCDILKKFFKVRKESSLHYYTLARLMNYGVRNTNSLLLNDIQQVLDHFKNEISKRQLIKSATQFIEKNTPLRDYRDITLYSHQKELFALCKSNEPKCILYQAPTGTGKTMSPIGLAKKKRLIFVCAAKHVGLQLAKSCISMGIKIAVAFGCEDPGGIRLHYFAAKDYTRNRRTGGIFRVDNEVGDNVEIMISDVMSYLPAMHYMLAFNEKEDLIFYWDEPTITLDYENHEYHELLKKNWSDNLIPNIVLSSATLPNPDDIKPCLHSFMVKFKSQNIHSIISHDCKRTIPIINKEGYVVLPHLVFPTYTELKKSLKHIKKYKTLLRHFSIEEVAKFIVYVNKNCTIKENLLIDNYFAEIGEITSLSLKEYYLKLLSGLKKEYDKVWNHFQENKNKVYKSNIKITTEDSYTLKDGPTIYLADDVEKIGKYCLKTADIPMETLDHLMKKIDKNEELREKIQGLEWELEKNQDASKIDTSKEKKLDRGETEKEKEIKRSIKDLKNQIRRIQLPSEFIPNSHEHLMKLCVKLCCWK